MIWGTTFVSTRVLLDYGLTPSGIFIMRFAIAYVGMALLSRKRWWADTLREEVLTILCAITGGSAYFLTENTALLHAPAGVVSFIVALAPLLTMLVAFFMPVPSRSDVRMWVGSLVAFIGVGMIVSGDMEGNNTDLKAGGLLALLAATSWAVYQNIVGSLTHKYGALFVTRKVFGYGLLTMLIYEVTKGIITEDNTFLLEKGPEVLLHPIVVSNILFLGLVASLLCYFTWNLVVERIGAVTSANYIYLNPLTTCLFSFMVLGEHLSAMMVLGGVVILLGLFSAVGNTHKGL